MGCIESRTSIGLRFVWMAMALPYLCEDASAAYTVQRVVDGLNQPMFVTQAPGDTSSLYIVERSDPGDQLGRIRVYNLQTRSFNPTPLLDLAGEVDADGGLLGMTFHPDFQTNGKFYVTTNVERMNALDEYRLVGGAAQLERRLLEYPSLVNVFHTINQPFFRPNGDASELFLTTGDGGTQATQPQFDPELIESPTSVYGKLLRFDLNASFPAPATDATHAGVDVVALGLRNPFRSSFDRQTGDFYMGDVGLNRAEEVDFIPASHFDNPAAPILDFGWTAREGTAEADSPHAGPKAPGDIDPIFAYAHSGQPLPHESVIHGRSITGGYVYRGPVEELQGRYFFADFLFNSVYSGSFDPATSASAFDGTNLTGIVEHTESFEAQVGGETEIRNVTSFGEDHAGNLYIVKFGNGFFPPLGQGEIFRITPAGVRSDLDFNGVVDGGDWSLFSTHAYTSLAGLSEAEAYGRGDLDGDGDNDFADFRLFKFDYNAVNGAGAFEALAGQVPEPASAGLVLTALAAAALAARNPPPSKGGARGGIQELPIS